MSYYAEEQYQFYNEPVLKARKPHTCDACKLTIPPGHRYVRISWCFDGRIESVKRCLRCQLIHEYLRGLGDGDMWPAEKLDCGEEFEPHWGYAPPEWLQSLAFWAVGDPLPGLNPCSDSGERCRQYWGSKDRCNWVNRDPGHRVLVQK
jgi:hypothetical protein